MGNKVCVRERERERVQLLDPCTSACSKAVPAGAIACSSVVHKGTIILYSLFSHCYFNLPACLVLCTMSACRAIILCLSLQTLTLHLPAFLSLVHNRANQLEDPLERFVAVTRYFLSGWHIKPKVQTAVTTTDKDRRQKEPHYRKSIPSSPVFSYQTQPPSLSLLSPSPRA